MFLIFGFVLFFCIIFFVGRIKRRKGRNIRSTGDKEMIGGGGRGVIESKMKKIKLCSYFGRNQNQNNIQNSNNNIITTTTTNTTPELTFKSITNINVPSISGNYSKESKYSKTKSNKNKKLTRIRSNKKATIRTSSTSESATRSANKTKNKSLMVNSLQFISSNYNKKEAKKKKKYKSKKG